MRNKFKNGLATALLGTALLASVSSAAIAAPQPISISLASCCVTESVMTKEIIPAFKAYWKKSTGQDVNFKTSFAGSGTLRNQIVGGSPVQVAVLSSELYLTNLKQAGLITSNWNSLPNDGTVARSVIVIVTRPGNPKKIDSFEDVTAKNLKVIHSSPDTSGGAQWSIFAIYGSVLKESEQAKGKQDADGALKLLTGVEKNVIAMPESAAQAVAQYDAGFGDVLITYENEAITERAKGKDYEIVTPRSTIETDWTVSRIDKNISADQKAAVDGFIKFLTTETAQKAFVEYGFRSVDAGLIAGDKRYAKVRVPFNVGYLGGWEKARKEIIDGYWKRMQGK